MSETESDPETADSTDTQTDVRDEKTDATPETDPRLDPQTYTRDDVTQVHLAGVRSSNLSVRGVTAEGHVKVRGKRGARMKLELATDTADVTLRYYAKTRGVWQPIGYGSVDDLTLYDRDGDEVTVDHLADDDASTTDPETDETDDTDTPQNVTDALTAATADSRDLTPDDDTDDAESIPDADSMLTHVGTDTTTETAPDDWQSVSPESDDAAPTGLDSLFGSDDDAITDYAARISPIGLLQLQRGDPITIDWDGATLTLYPPVADADGGDAYE